MPLTCWSSDCPLPILWVYIEPARVSILFALFGHDILFWEFTFFYLGWFLNCKVFFIMALSL